MGGAVGARHGLAAIHPLAGDRIITGVHADAERVAALLTEMGCNVERHPVPADVVRANGMISATNLIVRERFGPGPTIALNSHGDVVPPGLGWSTDPYGAVIADDYRALSPFRFIAVTGPNRGIAAGLNWHQAAPYGDMMLTGAFGLVEGYLAAADA